MGRYRAPAVAAEDNRSKRRKLALPGENADSVAAGSQETKKALYHCNYCNKDISGIIRIKCAKCPDFDLCVECFSIGAEVTPHKYNHPYRVIDNLCFPLIQPDWNADEEILLLEGVEMYGIGNWAEVAEHVATKTKAQCYDHYISAYMNSPYSPLPDMAQAYGKSKSELLAMTKAPVEGKKGNIGEAGLGLKPPKQEQFVSPLKVKVEERDVPGDGRSPSNASFCSGAGDKGDGRIFGNKSVTSTVGTLKKPGMEKENPQPATAVEDGGQSNRSIGGKKPKPLLEENKDGFANLEHSGYNPKRQEFDPEYDNDAELPLAEMEFKDIDTDTDRELKLQMLHIYLSRLDERKRRKEFILERGLLDIKRQQESDSRRTKEERELYQETRVFLRYHSTMEHEALLSGLGAEKRIRNHIAELQECLAAGCRTVAEAEQYKSEKRKREETLSAGGKGGLFSNRSNTFNITGLPGTDLLSLKEQELCCHNRIFPASYLRMKEILMLESLKTGQIRRADAKLLLKANPSKVDSVFNLLIKMGWIQGDASPISTEKC